MLGAWVKAERRRRGRRPRAQALRARLAQRYIRRLAVPARTPPSERVAGREQAPARHGRRRSQV
jgi:hypothetical protein